MALHTDIPTRAQVEGLLVHRAPCSVSIYLPTSRLPQDAHTNRVELTNLAAVAIGQLREAGASDDDVRAIEDAVKSLAEDDHAWTEMADTLVVFVTPAGIQTYRLPNRLGEVVEVSDRFHVKPLLRTATFPQAAFVLALAAGSVRLLHLAADGPPEEINVADLPRDAWDSSGNHVFKEREDRYIRLVERALRPVLNGQSLPLILAATEGVAATFRTVNTYPHLAAERSAGNPETSSDADLAAAARVILDEIYADEVKATKELFDLRRSQGRAATDVSEVARWATYGAVDTLFVDIDESLSGSIDDASGEVHLDTEEDATNYGVVDEIARRVFLAGGRVLAVRAGEVPGDGPTAAILRYAPMA
jgi:hypothetical protein